MPQCILLPHSTNIDQSVIVSAKKHYQQKNYQKRFIDEVIVMLEDEEEKGSTVTLRASGQLKISANTTSSLGQCLDVPAKTTENVWSPFLWRTETECKFLGFEVKDFQDHFYETGNDMDADVQEWLDDDGGVFT